MAGKWTEQTQNSGREDGKCGPSWNFFLLFFGNIILSAKASKAGILLYWREECVKSRALEIMNGGTFCSIVNKTIKSRTNYVLSAVA